MLYPSSHILIEATRLFIDCFYFKLNQQARECCSTTMLLHSKATSRFLSCPHVLLHHLPLLCWCSCLWDNAENQQWYPAKWGLLLVALKANKKKKKQKNYHLSHITGWFSALLQRQLYWRRLCAVNEQPKEQLSKFCHWRKVLTHYTRRNHRVIPLLPAQKASMPWLTITVQAVLKSPEVDLSWCSSAKQGFLPSFNYSSHR